MKKQLNIMIVGVGGQGTLFSSRLLGRAAIESGYDVKVSEVHGMSQRGGNSGFIRQHKTSGTDTAGF